MRDIGKFFVLKNPDGAKWFKPVGFLIFTDICICLTEVVALNTEDTSVGFVPGYFYTHNGAEPKGHPPDR